MEVDGPAQDPATQLHLPWPLQWCAAVWNRFGPL